MDLFARCSIRRVAVTEFHSVSMPNDFCCHVVGKTRREMSSTVILALLGSY